MTLVARPPVARAAMPSRIPIRVHNRRASAPSKLEQLAANYQKKLSEEKERRLTQIYQDESDRSLRAYGSAGNTNTGYSKAGMNNGYGGRDHGIVREFFQERKAVQNGLYDNRHYHDNIRYHYEKKKAHTYHGSSTTKPPLLNQNRSSGRDKAQPLAPIIKSPTDHQNGGSFVNSPKPPVNTRPQLARNNRRSSFNGTDSPIDLHSLPSDRALIPIGPKQTVLPGIGAPKNEERESAPNSATRYGRWKEEQDQRHQMREEQRKHSEPSPQIQRRQIRQPSPQRKPMNAPPSPKLQKKPINATSSSPGVVRRSPQVQRKALQPVEPTAKPEKLTSFQKWQMEQDQAREERLKNHSEKNSPQFEHETTGYESDLSSQHANKAVKPSSQRPPSGKMQQRKQAVLKHVRQPSDLDSDEDEDEEQAELRKKQARLEELIALQKKELEEMRLKRQQEDEKEKRESEKLQKRVAAQKDRMKKLDAESERQSSRLSRKSSHPDVVDGYQSNLQSHRTAYSPAATPIAPSPPVTRKPVRLRRKSVQPPPQSPSPNNDSEAFYVEIAATEGAVADVDLAPCPACGRKFATNRLAKHAKVCQAASKKKRKVYDPVKMRAAGTDYAKYAADAAKAKRQKKPVKKNWRAQHESFIEAIRYAKKVTEVESAGGNIANLPPPPRTENPDYKQCPYCERRFAPTTADRHIPFCKDIKSRPAPLKRRGR